MRYSPACKYCVLNYDCLLQDNDDVESCEDVIEYELSKAEQKGKNDE